MKAAVREVRDGVLCLELAEDGALYRVMATEHGLRDIEFVLAQRRAMTSRCDEEDGEHTCGLDTGHASGHLCRGCTRSWRAV